jgi:pimeloyl-ACP methyl ester carboxylesterase
MSELIELDVDNEKIIGIFHKAEFDPDSCIIMCHGLLSNKDSVKYIVMGEACEKFGHSALRFDFRGCGESEGNIKNTTVSKRADDLNMVIDYAISELGFKKIGLFGSSLGGYLSLLKTIQEPRVKTVVCISSPYSMLELINQNDISQGYMEIDNIRIEGTFFDDLADNDDQLKNGLAKISSPVLLFQGDRDTLVPMEHAFKIFENLNAQKDLKILSGAEHLIISPKYLSLILKTSFSWFNKYLWEGDLDESG